MTNLIPFKPGAPKAPKQSTAAGTDRQTEQPHRSEAEGCGDASLFVPLDASTAGTQAPPVDTTVSKADQPAKGTAPTKPFAGNLGPEREIIAGAARVPHYGSIGR